MVRQCGLWKRRGFHHGTHDRVDPIDDPCPMPSAAAFVQVSVAATDSAAAESGDTGTFTITREGNTSKALDVYFGLTGTADIGVDYTASVSSPVTIPAGASSVTVTITPLQDAVSEGNETVILSLVPTTYGPIYDIDWSAHAATVTIEDAPSIQDTFTRADSAALGITEVGAVAWEVDAGSESNWGIRDGQGALIAGFGNELALLETPWSDFTLEVTFPGIEGTLNGLAFRGSAGTLGDSWIVAVDDPPTWTVYTVDDGVATEVADTGVTAADGDVVNVRAVGSDIVVKINGIVRATLSDSWQQTGTRHGLAQRSSSFYDGRWDDVSITPAT